jgi:hypothetical protein
VAKIYLLPSQFHPMERTCQPQRGQVSARPNLKASVSCRSVAASDAAPPADPPRSGRRFEDRERMTNFRLNLKDASLFHRNKPKNDAGF